MICWQYWYSQHLEGVIKTWSCSSAHHHSCSSILELVLVQSRNITILFLNIYSKFLHTWAALLCIMMWHTLFFPKAMQSYVLIKQQEHKMLVLGYLLPAVFISHLVLLIDLFCSFPFIYQPYCTHGYWMT